MSMIDRSLDGMAFLSGQLGAMLRRRLREMGGIALLSLAMMAALALATWSVHDPSLSHATDARVHNLLGRPGAVAADLMMQLLGLGSLALLLPIGVWGYRLLGHRPLGRERLRVLLWVFGAVLAAAFASCLPRGSHWPLPCGLGGVVGDAILRVPAVLLGAPLTGLSRLAAAIALGIAALVTFAGAAGIVWRGSPDEEEDTAEADDEDEGAWISLGRLMHAALSFRTRVALILRRRAPRWLRCEETAAAPPQRVEPRFDGRPDPRTEEEAEDEIAGVARATRSLASPARRQSRRAARTAGTSFRRSNSSVSPARSAGPPSAAKCCRKTQLRSKACSPISACAARSSMRGRGRWSRCTSWSPRPASNRRASSVLPTTSPAP